MIEIQLHKVIEENEKSYFPISENAFNTVNNLVKYLYVDEKFDEIMIYILDKIFNNSKKIQKYQKCKFPDNSNILNRDFNISFQGRKTFLKIKKLIKNILEITKKFS